MLRGLRASWLDTLRRRGFSGAEVEIEPSAPPLESASWNWWLTFRSGDRELDALAGPGLEALLFEDEQGRFEIEVPIGRVADHLARVVQSIARTKR